MDVFDISTCSKKVPYLSNIKAQATALLALDGFPIGKTSTLQWLSIENQQGCDNSDVSFILTIFPKNFWNK